MNATHYFIAVEIRQGAPLTTRGENFTFSAASRSNCKPAEMREAHLSIFAVEHLASVPPPAPCKLRTFLLDAAGG
ncbi:hypothetical protein ATY81_03665 [Rhizobium sp. R72]|nr:hypothetical protein ATY81_03665 [Rhizobium sp. R72]OWW06125.1 hypothetical protein ATY80_03665 [Rhizobium sp. R711]